MYEGVYAEIISTDKFDEDTGISTTYLGTGRCDKEY